VLSAAALLKFPPLEEEGPREGQQEEGEGEGGGGDGASDEGTGPGSAFGLAALWGEDTVQVLYFLPSDSKPELHAVL